MLPIAVLDQSRQKVWMKAKKKNTTKVPKVIWDACNKFYKFPRTKRAFWITSSKRGYEEFDTVCVGTDGKGNICIPNCSIPPDVALWLAAEIIATVRYFNLCTNAPPIKKKT